MEAAEKTYNLSINIDNGVLYDIAVLKFLINKIYKFIIEIFPPYEIL